MAKPQTQHHSYAQRMAMVKKCRDATEGEDAVHKAGEAYLPRLKDQENDDYKAYVTRTPFFNATARTINGLVGMIFRKAPVIEVNGAIESYLEDITLTNTPFNEFAEQCANEYLEVGGLGLLVEYPQVTEQAITRAQQEAQNLRPYVTEYNVESIINWRYGRVNNVVQPIMVVLSESAVTYDEYEEIKVPQLRALWLENGIYLQRVYQKPDNKKDEWLQVGGDIIPLMNGKPLPFIPFVYLGELDCDDIDPPLYDLVNLNLSHYRTSADLELGAHFTGLPTAVVSGYQADTGEKLYIGSSTAWIFPDPQAKASYLEFTGQGLGALANLKKEKEAGMAALGARMLAPEKTGVEASETLRLRHSGEGAVLSSVVNIVNAGLTKVLHIIEQWAGVDESASVVLNKDFIEQGLTAQSLLALVQSWQAGGMPKEELFYNLKAGEVIRQDTTYEQYTAMLETELPQLGDALNANSQ